MEVKQKVEALIADIEKTHKYSMSRIYGLYNEVFSLAEAPQSCASCLIRKVNELKQWLVKQPNNLQVEAIIPPIDSQIDNSIKKKRGRKPINLS